MWKRKHEILLHNHFPSNYNSFCFSVQLTVALELHYTIFPLQWKVSKDIDILQKNIFKILHFLACIWLHILPHFHVVHTSVEGN